MESCKMWKAKGMNTLVSHTIYTNGAMCYKVSNLPSNLFSYARLTDWLGRKHSTLLKGDGSRLKRKPRQAQRSNALKIHPFFSPPNNIFLITTLHLLPLLQISCWKKWTYTKDPGESWDSVLIGKPFNILKYNLTFLSIEQPLWGWVAGGNKLYSHRNLLARTNKWVLSPAFILFSLI